MTVYELIQELLQHPADMEVRVMLSDESGTAPAGQVRFCKKDRWEKSDYLEIVV